MRVRLIINFYCLLIICLISDTNISAHTIYPDTTKLIAAIPRNLPLEYKTLAKSANVIYPSILEDHREQSLEYIEKFSDKKRDYLIHIYQRGKKYFPKIEGILKRYQLPEELKVLIALESGFNGNAVSKVGAVGYWQIMDDAAKEYGLQIVTLKDMEARRLKKSDDRKNLSKSTLFAAKYLRDRWFELNADILLIVASYNCGVGRVRSAIRRSGKASPGFWDVKNYLPPETRNFVMKFIAFNVIFENYEKFVQKQLVFSQPAIEARQINTLIDNESLQDQPIGIN